MIPPFRLAVLGATGRVGRLVVATALERPDLTLVAAFASPGSAHLNQDTGTLVGRPPSGIPIRSFGVSTLPPIDVLIDFSLPDGLAEALHTMDPSTALVTGTTGLPDDTRGALELRARTAPVLRASNFSVGIAVLQDLVARASRALPDYDVEVVEVHHRDKRDAPSGTAKTLAEAVAQGRGDSETPVGMHALRMGDVVGEHQVWLAGPGDRVLLGHTTTHRSTYAEGALRAARWLHGRGPGDYTMRHVLGLTP